MVVVLSISYAGTQLPHVIPGAARRPVQADDYTPPERGNGAGTFSTPPAAT
ncbi:hypothetical protein FHR53_000408 [Xanthomonas arboricola]